MQCRYAERHYAERRFPDYHYAESHYAGFHAEFHYGDCCRNFKDF
jgi:hypothetical protein